ncbi:MAG: YigZ family protein [Halobaculum sp.]
MDTYRTVGERATASFEVRGSEFLGHVAPAADPTAAEAFVSTVRAEYDDATHNVPAYRVPVDSGSGSASDGSAPVVDDSAPTADDSAPTADDSAPTADDSAPTADDSNTVTDDSSSTAATDQTSTAERAGTSRTPTGDGMLREYSSDDGEPSGSAGKPALNVLQQRDLRGVVCVVTRYYGGTNLGVGGLARAYSRAVKEAVDAAGVVERRPREQFAVTVAYDDSGSVRGLLESAGVEFDADYAERVTFVVSVPTDEAAALRDEIRSATSGRADID